MNYSTTAEHGLTPTDRSRMGWIAAATQFLRGAFNVPELSPEQRVAREAEQVRAMAERHRSVDPGFASDLYAAADRHEHHIETGATR